VPYKKTMLFSTFLLIILLITWYLTDTPTIVYHNVLSTFHGVKALRMLVSTQYTNIAKILWVMFVIICKTIYINVCQKLNKSIRRIDKNTYEISYVVNGILYKMIVKPTKGPKCIIEAVDENDNDITQEFMSYFGPMENFHGNHTTPRFFSKQKITLSLITGDELTFDENEIMQFKLH
jgi:hypothetical protein